MQIYYLIGPKSEKDKSFVRKDFSSVNAVFFDIASVYLAIGVKPYEELYSPNLIQKFTEEMCVMVIAFLQNALLTQKKIIVFESIGIHLMFNALLKPLQPVTIWLGNDPQTSPKREFHPEKFNQ